MDVILCVIQPQSRKPLAKKIQQVLQKHSAAPCFGSEIRDEQRDFFML